jgi:hypothetical protein
VSLAKCLPVPALLPARADERILMFLSSSFNSAK